MTVRTAKQMLRAWAVVILITAIFLLVEVFRSNPDTVWTVTRILMAEAFLTVFLDIYVDLGD